MINDVFWIKNEDSIFDTTLKQIPYKEHIINITSEFKSIDGIEFDGLFLCKSNQWTPPHLDKKMNKLIETLTSNFTNIRLIEKDNLENRFDAWFKNEVKNLYNSIFA